eukprot:2132074-Pyramimonas_sp.AAC.1
MDCNRLQHAMHDRAALRPVALDIFWQCCLCLIRAFHLSLNWSVSSLRRLARSAFKSADMAGIVARARAPQLTGCVLSTLNQLGCDAVARH